MRWTTVLRAYRTAAIRPTRLALVLLLIGVAVAASLAGRAPSNPREIIVGLHDGASTAAYATQLAAYGATVTHRIDSLGVLVAILPGPHARAVEQRLRDEPGVAYVERAPRMWPAAVPNDPIYERGDQWNITKIQAPEAWDLLPPDGVTVVAVVDTGIDFGHPDLRGRILGQGCDLIYGVCQGEGRRFPAEDRDGHGTHVAGIIGANTGNSLGIASVSNGRVLLLPIRVEIGVTGVFANTLEAIVFAADSGAKVINGSFGGECTNAPSQTVDRMVNYLEARGALLVMSAGNGSGCVNGRFPHAHPQVLAVAATDRDDALAPFSNRGAWVDVAAPGVRIVSTVPGGYAALSGTSMAAPHVSGAAALLFQVPGATKAKVMEWLLATCDGRDLDVRCGGRINVYRAVHLAIKGWDPLTQTPPASPEPSPSPSVTPTPAPNGSGRDEP